MGLKLIKVYLNEKVIRDGEKNQHMKIQNVDVTSLITPETKYITVTSEFIPDFAEEFPVFTSYNGDGVVLRKLILLSKKNIITGYKYDVEVKEGDGGLTSLYDMSEVIVTMKAKKYKDFMTASLTFVGFKKERIEKILILYDVPIVSNNKEDLLSQIKSFLKSFYGIEIDQLPAKFKVEHKHFVKAKITDVDYAYTLL